MKHKNKILRDKRGFELLGENTVQLIIAVLCVVILIILGVSLYDFIIGGKTDVKKAEYELKEMNASLRSIIDDKTEIKYIVTTIQGWSLFTDESGGLCGGNFCLCVCKDESCSKNSPKACISTDKFVRLIENGESKRMIKLNSPSQLKMSLSNKEVYPFNGGVQAMDYGIIAFGIVPIYFKFDNEWKWSPDLDNWMPVTTTVVSGGKLDGQKPMEGKQEFINFFSRVEGLKDSENRGISLFNQINVHKSTGVYIIQQ